MGLSAPHLKRNISLWNVVSTSAGLTFASSTFLVVVQMACYLSGDSAWIAVTIAGLLCLLAAMCFSELNGMWPSVNGIRLYVFRAFGEKASLVIALTYMSVVTLVVGTEAYVLSHVLNDAFPSIPPPWWIFVMLTAATFFNFRGVKIAGNIQSLLTYSVVVSILIMSILALAKVHFAVPQPTSVGSVSGLFQAVAVAVFLFVGFEWVTPLADEVKDPKSIPKGMIIAIGILVVSYSAISTAMFAGLQGTPRTALLGNVGLRNPTPHILFAHAAFGSAGRWVMVGTSLCMSLTTFNAGLMSVSRFVYGMARESVLPKQLASISARFSTPDKAVFAIYVVALVISGAVYWTQKFVLLVNLAAGTESIIYAIAALCIIVLRIKDPQRTRPFRMSGGLLLPSITAAIFALLGVGVFAQPTFEYWGAGVVLLLVVLGWLLYVHFTVQPRLAGIRAEAANRASRRPSRRPTQVD